jgi:death-on-curing protein
MHALATNHALIDGNKRLAWACCRVFCLMNGKELNLSIDEAEEIIILVASGNYGVEEIVKAIGPQIY